MFSALKSIVKRRLLLAKNKSLSIGAKSLVYDSEFGENCRIANDSVVISSRFGRYSYSGPRCVFVNAEIGQFCSIASEVHVGSGSHPSKDYVSSHPMSYLSRPEIGWNFVDRDIRSEFSPTNVGHDVWIGARAIVRDGVRIGHGAIIGAGAVVVKDVEPYAIYGGVPAKKIRMRFSDKEIDFLLELEWWNKSYFWIKSNISSFRDIQMLMKSLKISL